MTNLCNVWFVVAALSLRRVISSTRARLTIHTTLTATVVGQFHISCTTYQPSSVISLYSCISNYCRASVVKSLITVFNSGCTRKDDDSCLLVVCCNVSWAAVCGVL